MKRSDILFILSSFLIWRIVIFIFAFAAIKFVPVFSHNYFGGGYSNYLINPLFWGHLNFDGEHYLAIAQNGYQPFEYFFFPLFPLIVKNLSFNNAQMTLAATGLVVSNLSFLIGLIGIYKLTQLDYKEKIAKLTVILLLIFPTSFYFGSYYTESLFFMLVVWAFYFARKNKILFASIIAGFATATRVIGFILIPVIIIEFFKTKKYKIWPILISPIGLFSYMYFLLKKTGDPLIFIHQVVIFGEQRSSALISLPQVYYRYIFEILPSVSYAYFPNFFTTYLEFGITTLFLILIIYSFWRLRISYAIFGLLAFLIPTFAGSFSSMPRYVLVIFPVFILVANFIEKKKPILRYIIYFVMILLLFISTAMFWRGYWLS